MMQTSLSTPPGLRAGVSRTSRGFTLIELLVVIAIIAILAAILFPVFAQAREKARQISCLSNLKQLGTATMMYVQDYDESYPRGFYPKPSATATWQLVTWQELVAPYVKNGERNDAWFGGARMADGVFTCPNVPRGIDGVYGGHSGIMPGYFGATLNPADIMPSVSMAGTPRPADTVLVAEIGYVAQWGNADRQGLDVTFWDHLGQSSWTLEGPNSGAKFDADPTPTGPCNGAAQAWPCFSMPRYRHANNSNMIFADGHAKAMQKGRLNFCRNIYVPGVAERWNRQTADFLFNSGQACANYPR